MSASEFASRLLVALRGAPDAAGKAAAIGAVLRDREALASLARWAAGDPDGYEAAVLDLEAVPGASSRVASLRAAVRRAVAAVEVEQDEGERTTRESAPVDDPEVGAVAVPDGWDLAASGVWHERVVDGERVVSRVTSTPIAVVEVLESLRGDHAERVRLRWRRGSGAWCDQILPRSAVRDARRVISLADHGVDVGSPSARGLVMWLSAQESEGGQMIPRSAISDRMGWLGESGELGFLVGESHVPTPARRRCALDVSDPGRAQLASSMEPSGTLHGWREAVARVSEYPSVMLALYASLAAPLLGILSEAPSAILDWSGGTSRGKTTSLSLAASVWAHPRKGQHYVHSWDATPAYIEGAADCLRHLPLCLDDTRDAKDPAALERLIYTYAGESGRGRARPDGLRASLEVRGVLLSTGEQPITSFGGSGGARARSLCLRGWPLGDAGHHVAVELLAALSEHHGVAGPAVVRWLVDHADQWGELRAMWRADRAGAAEASSSNVGKRLAALWAFLAAGARLAHDVLGIPVPAKDPLVFAGESADQQAEEADRAAVAVAACYAWACAHEAEFWGREVRDKSTNEARQPSSGWAGRWTRASWDEIAWVPGCLERVLKYEGFRPEEILSAWVDRGWLAVDGKNRGRKRSIGEYGGAPRCLVLPRSVIEQVTGVSDGR